MKLIYVAGKYRGETANEIYWNINGAREVAEAILRLCPGWFPVTPHLNTAFMDGLADDEVFLEGDKELLKRCDAVYMMPYWEESEGATAEREFALKNNIPVYETLTELQEANK